MDCLNLQTESKTETFLNGQTETFNFPFCNIKKESNFYAAEMSRTLRESGVEIGTLVHTLCPFALASRIDFEKCPWYNRPSFK
jgi:hypothetical protein